VETGHLGHAEECIVLLRAIEETLVKYSPCAGSAGGVRPGAENAQCGEEYVQRMRLFKNKHFKNDGGNKVS